MEEEKNKDSQEENNRDITTIEIILTAIQELFIFACLATKFWCKEVIQKISQRFQWKKK